MSIKLITELKEFQVKTVEWMYKHESKYDGGLLMNEPGLGKSICILSTIISNPCKTLIVCPTGLIDNWMNEIEKHTNIKNVVKYYGPKRGNIGDDDDNLIYVTSYSIVSREYEGEKFSKSSIFNKMKFKRIVLDEAHYIRNTNSSVCKSILFLSDDMYQNIKKWIVTATPIFNSPNDAFAYFKFLGYEGIDSKRDWTKIICKNVNGLKTLNNWLEKYGLKLKKSNVLNELNDKNEIILKLKFNDIEEEFYNALKEYSSNRMKLLINRFKLINDSDVKQILRTNVMVYILRLRQVCDSPWLILDKMDRLSDVNNIKDAVQRLNYFNTSKSTEEDCPICYDVVADYIADPCGHKCCKNCWDKIKMMKVNIVNCPLCNGNINNILNIQNDINSIKKVNNICIDDMISSKIEKILSITKDVINKNEKIVIVSQWVKMLEIIKSVFKNEMPDCKFVSLQGNVSLKNRTDAINEFQMKDEVKVCFVSLMSSAEGINLVSANNMILVDSWWNNAKMVQVMDRIHRIGQNKDVHIYNLQIINSIEENMEKLINKKSKVSNILLDKWKIKDIKKYDDSWVKDVIKLV